MRKFTFSAIIALLLVFVVVGIAFAVSTGVNQAIPFMGTVQATATTEPVDPQNVRVLEDASGEATHLGRFTAAVEGSVNVVTLAGTNSWHFVAANGDSLFAEGPAQATWTVPPEEFVVVEDLTITGGTGRFEGATGSVTVERLVSTVTESSIGEFDGYIVLH